VSQLPLGAELFAPKPVPFCRGGLPMKRTGSRCSRSPALLILAYPASLACRWCATGIDMGKISGFCHATGTDAIAKPTVHRLYAYHDSLSVNSCCQFVVQPAAATSPYSSPVLTKLDRWKLTRYSSAGCQPCRGLTLLGIGSEGSDREHFCPPRYMCSGRCVSAARTFHPCRLDDSVARVKGVINLG